MAVDPNHGLYIQTFLAEIIGRYSHLLAFVRQSRKDAHERAPHLFAAYSAHLRTALTELVEFTPVVESIASTVMDVEDLIPCFDYLIDHSKRYQTNHSALRSFATPWPQTDVTQFLNKTFDENGLAAKFEMLHPTVIQLDEFNFFKYDLRGDLFLPEASSKLAVWALPKAESSNPFFWPLLTHEKGKK